MSLSEFGALPIEERIIPTRRLQEEWRRSIENPETYWAEKARQLDWFRMWDKVFQWDLPFHKWFVGGVINASFNCLDRHVEASKRNKIAIIWEGEPGDVRILSYGTMYTEVNLLASVLESFGVGKGVFVGLYMPMLPELPMAMLACSRLGAPFTQVYSGFSAGALAERIRLTEAKVLITADGLWRRGRIIDLKKIADLALKDCPSIEKVIVVKRIGHEVAMEEGRDYWHHDLIRSAPKRYIIPEPVESNHPLYVLYTSGTTAKPKGALHSTGGYLTYVCTTLKWSFDVRDEDVWWCLADVGWVTGHSYIVFAPLAHGLTEIMYEGAPEHPEPDRIWDMVERYGVTKFYTTPTTLRLLMRYGDEWPRKHDLSSLKILGTVGEPINPEVWRWYFEVIGGGRCPISDTWWQTETGGFCIAPAPGIQLVQQKPGSAIFPLPGIDPEIVDEEGLPLPPGEKGQLVIKKPWPGLMLTLFKDDERYRKFYWERFPKRRGIFYTGDFAVQDKDGYYWLLGRADDVIKVAGHRLGTIELEDVLVSHPAVAESAVSAKEDPVKGDVPVAFVVLKVGQKPSSEMAEELKQHVRNAIGPVATLSELHFVPILPKTRSGKIMRRVIKAVIDGNPVGDITTLEDEAAVKEVLEAVESFRKALEK